MLIPVAGHSLGRIEHWDREFESRSRQVYIFPLLCDMLPFGGTGLAIGRSLFQKKIYTVSEVTSEIGTGQRA